MFCPKRLPVKMRMPLGFCDAGSTYKFIIKGKWKTPIAEISPQIVFRMNKTHEVFHWDFREGDKVRGPHKYHIWAKEKRDNKTSSAVTLSSMDLNLKKIPDFNMTITCVDFNTSGKFKVELNYWDSSNGLPRDSYDWDIDAPMATVLNPDDVTEVEILGNIEVEYAGCTMDGCLALAPNGLVIEMKGDDCTVPLDGVCEHQSCYTMEGNECVFPFDYKEVTYYNCSSVDVYQPWCATGN